LAWDSLPGTKFVSEERKEEQIMGKREKREGERGKFAEVERELCAHFLETRKNE
jgi:hypothetical protein